MAILGLCSTETWSAYRELNIRRSVQYYYPNGKAPLIGLLSLMDEESTNDSQFSHWEKRMVQQRTITAVQTANLGWTGRGPFTISSTSAVGGTPTEFADEATWTVDSYYRVYIADDTYFRKGHVVKIVATISAVDKDLFGIVTDIDRTNNFLVVRAIGAYGSATTDTAINVTLVKNLIGDVGDEVLVIGSAFAEGLSDMRTNTSEVSTLPLEFTNYVQIFRTMFSITGRAVKTPLKWDETGGYRDKAKEHAIQHMIEMEKAFLFGRRDKYVASGDATPSSGAGLPTTTTGGVIYYLERWEAGDYGSVTASSDSDDDKRIIENAGGNMDEDTFDTYMERLFRNTASSSNEKLCLCGSGFLKTINQLFRSKSVLNTNIPSRDAYGMVVSQLVTPFGSVYFKTHPLFNQNSTLRNNALFLDTGNLKYRYFEGRDTTLLKDREANDGDYKQSEWFTDAGLELWQPEAHLYLKNVRTYSP